MVGHLFARPPWEHQRIGVKRTIQALSNGTDSACLTAPTGSGKSLMMVALTKWELESNRQVLLLTNRILLTEQTCGVFQSAGVPVGVISASMKSLERPDAPVQIATIQTILARRRTQTNYWVDADLVLADECHQLSEGSSADLLNEYKGRGAKVVGVTATPLGVSNVCDELIVAARTRDLQDAGILCFASWFAPSELDTRKLVKGKVDLSLSENDARRTWGPLKGNDHIRTRIVGNILEHYRRLHPEQTHTLAFAPGVKESLWAAQFCYSQGIRALHVDGTDFWVDGEMFDRRQSDDKFHAARQAWRDGEIPILFNRYVMREGIDEPQIKCIILATPVGSYRSFLQMVGRGLRTHESKDKLLVIDHGGCLDEETEILTRRGWLGIDDMREDDLIGTLNMHSNAFEWCPNLGTIRKPCDSKMLAFDTVHASVRVTDYHNMVMKKDTGSGDWKMVPAYVLEHRKKNWSYPTSAIENVPDCHLTDDELGFIGWFLTDGGMDSNDTRIRIYQSTNAPRLHHDHIIKCLDGCGFRYSIRTRERTCRGKPTYETSYSISSGRKSKGGWERLRPWLDKSFPLAAFDFLSQRQFGVLMYAINLGDGSKWKQHKQKTMCIAISPREFADNLQSLAVRRGYRCNISTEKPNRQRKKPLYLARIRKSAISIISGFRTRMCPSIVKPGERVWCVQTRNGTIVTRRKDKVFIMGNSWWRFGSVNVNVDWESVFDCQDPDTLSKNRIAEARETGESVGSVCPKCGMVHKFGRMVFCQYCGHKIAMGKVSRAILQADGTLTQVTGEPIIPWKIRATPEAQKIWEGLYWNAVKNKGGEVTFNQLYSQFGYRTAVMAGTRERPAFWKSYYPPRDLEFMPKKANDFHRQVGQVSRENLY